MLHGGEGIAGGSGVAHHGGGVLDRSIAWEDVARDGVLHGGVAGGFAQGFCTGGVNMGRGLAQGVLHIGMLHGGVLHGGVFHGCCKEVFEILLPQ